jgi:aryl-alcohol dehydrogenase-like predicted oxidoreductase
MTLTMPTARFGRTGHESSRVIFGAAALGEMSPHRALATIEAAVAAGVNHLDTAHSYGRAEDLMAPWLAEHRQEVFLATKTGERTADAAWAGVNDSLRRMGVDQIDLIQLHNLAEEDEWRTVFSPGGALEAVVRARDEGLVRFIGVTGHGMSIPAMHLRSLAEFDFDTVLFPYNRSLLTDTRYADEVEELVSLCASRDVAVQTIKSIAKGRWGDSYEGPRYSWYEPLRDPAAIDRAVRFVLGRDRLFLNSTSDATLLPAVLEAAQAARVGDVPTDDELLSDMSDHGITPLFDRGDLAAI